MFLLPADSADRADVVYTETQNHGINSHTKPWRFYQYRVHAFILWQGLTLKTIIAWSTRFWSAKFWYWDAVTQTDVYWVDRIARDRRVSNCKFEKVFVDRINFVLKSQHKLSFKPSKYWTIWWNRQITAFGKNHGKRQKSRLPWFFIVPTYGLIWDGERILQYSWLVIKMTKNW